MPSDRLRISRRAGCNGFSPAAAGRTAAGQRNRCFATGRFGRRIGQPPTATTRSQHDWPIARFAAPAARPTHRLAWRRPGPGSTSTTLQFDDRRCRPSRPCWRLPALEPPTDHSDFAKAAAARLPCCGIGWSILAAATARCRASPLAVAAVASRLAHEGTIDIAGQRSVCRRRVELNRATRRSWPESSKPRDCNEPPASGGAARRFTSTTSVSRICGACGPRRPRSSNRARQEAAQIKAKATEEGRQAAIQAAQASLRTRLDQQLVECAGRPAASRYGQIEQSRHAWQQHWEQSRRRTGGGDCRPHLPPRTRPPAGNLARLDSRSARTGRRQCPDDAAAESGRSRRARPPGRKHRPRVDRPGHGANRRRCERSPPAAAASIPNLARSISSSNRNWLASPRNC